MPIAARESRYNDICDSVIEASNYGIAACGDPPVMFAR